MRFAASLKIALVISMTCGSGTVAFAQKKGSSLERQTVIKNKKGGNADRTNVDFDEADITGQARNPFNSLLNARDQEGPGDFIRLRKHWHDQMIISVSGLSQ